LRVPVVQAIEQSGNRFERLERFELFEPPWALKSNTPSYDSMIAFN